MAMTSPYIEKMKREHPHCLAVAWYDPKRMLRPEEVAASFPAGFFSWGLPGLKPGRAFAFKTAKDLARFENDFVKPWRKQL